MQLLVESTAVVMFKMIADAKLEPVLSELLYYFERDEARHVGLGVLALPDVLAGLSDREALALWWFQTKMQLEMIASGMTLREAFITVGVDQAQMNKLGFRYHAEILRRMKKQDHTTGWRSGSDQRGVKGLFKISKQGQDRFQELLFPTKPQPGWQRALMSALVTAADRTDRWLASRAP
ncbi:MAG: hypothetical protein JWO36_6543 [Myxococcales bacterium]|nr:hypothetical protein [Myxococcales bacterium]